MDYKVETTREAERDIDAQISWIIEHDSSSAAQHWYDRLKERIYGLQQFPFRFSLAPENEFSEHELRQFICFSQRVFYTVEEDRVIVLHVRHASREFDD